MPIAMTALIAAAFAADPPTHGVIITIDAYGTPMAGHLVVDADAVAALGITFVSDEGEPRTGPVVPLMHGLVVKGTPKGDRIVQDAVDSLMYFDANGDNYLDAADPVFAHLGLFVDRNADQAAQAGEVKKLGELGVEAISRFGSIRMKDRAVK